MTKPAIERHAQLPRIRPIAGLRRGMEAAMQEVIPDSGKWTGVNSFALAAISQRNTSH